MKKYFLVLLVIILVGSAAIFLRRDLSNDAKLSKPTVPSPVVEQPIPATAAPAKEYATTPAESAKEIAGRDFFTGGEEGQYPSPLVRSKKDPTIVTTSAFQLTVPVDWTIDPIIGKPDPNIFGSMSFGQKPSDAYLSDTAMTIAIDRIDNPNGLPVWNDRLEMTPAIRKTMVEYWQKENPSLQLTEKDIVIFDVKSQEFKEFNLYRFGFQCLKACYAEGLPPTHFSYFLDTVGQTYQFDVQMNTSKNTEALTQKAEAIIQSFKLTK